MRRIYLSPPDLSGTERDLLGQALDSGWIAPLGPHVDAFEADVCRLLDVPYGLAVSSGTAALHLALLSLGIGAGDEVWISTLTFAATANAVAYTRATPVFVDSSIRTWNLDAELLAEALDAASAAGRLPKAVIVVDLYGHCSDLVTIGDVCRRHGVVLIEDAAEALGATHRNRPAGSFGDLSILSFNGNKIITTSGGGMLLSRNAGWIERARFLATQAREPARHYEHHTIGYNYRLSNLLAAVGRAQLADLERRVDARRAVNARYREALGDLPGWSFMPEAPDSRSTFWLTCATIASDVSTVTRDEVLDHLAAADIEARPVWKPLHLQKAFHGSRLIGGTTSEHLFRDGICLPSGSNLSTDDQDRVIRTIRNTRATS